MSSQPAKWRKGLHEARAFHQANGHLRVHTDHVTSTGFRLGSWINNKRVEAKAGKLSAERRAALDEIGMVWDAYEDVWSHGLAEARAFHQAHGHLRVPAAHVTSTGFRLGSWITNRKADDKDGRLSVERRAALDELGMVWRQPRRKRPVRDVVSRAAHWQHGLEEARAFHQAHGHLRVPMAHVTSTGFRLGVWIGRRRIDAKAGRLDADRKAALDELGMAWDVFEEAWQQGLAAARAFRRAHGHLQVPEDFVAGDGLKLGRWIAGRRTDRKAGNLSAERVAALDELDMVWDLHDESWQQGLREARAYSQAHGHLRVPAAHVTSTGFRLGVWIGRRRVDAKAGKLSAERRAALNEIGMVWDALEEAWLQCLAAARAFRRAHGHLKVPEDFVAGDGLKLGRWIAARRADRKAGNLSAERVATLDELDMVWDLLDESRQQGPREARAYSQVHGHLRVPYNFVTTSGFRLGQWINNKRVEAKAGKLSAERRAALDELGMVWDAFEDVWIHGLAEARAFHQAHGHLRVPAAHVTSTGFRLGVWITNRKADDKAGKLSVERRAALDEIGMVWSVRDQKWERGLEELRAFRSALGHARVPAQHVTESGYRLGRWMTSRRHELRLDRLTEDRKAQLDELGDWAAARASKVSSPAVALPEKPSRQVAAWSHALEEARVYRQDHGHLDVPAAHATASGFKLGAWIAARRKDLKDGKLSPERKAALDALGMRWSRDDQWTLGLAEARAYHQAHGHLRVPTEHLAASGFKLGVWIVRQREALHRGRMSAKRQAGLDALGMIWDAYEHLWEQGLQELQAYHRAHGNILMPKQHVTESGFRLWEWVIKRRYEFSVGRMTEQRKAQLDALGFVWDPTEELWLAGLAEARLYREMHGDLLVPYGHIADSGMRLGLWISNRRQDRRKGRLSDERKATLESLGMVWRIEPKRKKKPSRTRRAT